MTSGATNGLDIPTDRLAAEHDRLTQIRTGATFARVLAGVDGTEAGFDAVRQAATLVAPDGWLELFSAVYLVGATLSGWPAERVAEELEREAGATMRRAKALAGAGAESRLVNGPPLEALLAELGANRVTLAVVGTHGHSRLSEVMVGGVAGTLLHEAACSTLIARPPLTEALFPRALVAGIDGSAESERAAAAAQYLAERLGVPCRYVTASRARSVDVLRARRIAPVEVVDDHPVPALVDASQNADLLIVGTRGLRGIRSLGSVSERVAHQAVCSVLVVRAESG